MSDEKIVHKTAENTFRKYARDDLTSANLVFIVLSVIKALIFIKYFGVFQTNVSCVKKLYIVYIYYCEN